MNDFSVEQILTFGASLEKKSEHPLAVAVVRAAKKRNLKLEESRRLSSVARLRSD